MKQLPPKELRQLDQWVVWKPNERNGKVVKPPLQVNGQPASTTDPTTWTSFEEASDMVKSGGFEGVGFVFTDDDDYLFFELDLIAKTIYGRNVIKRLNTYAEYSPSKIGAHSIMRAKLPGKNHKLLKVLLKDGESSKHSVELYQTKRYATWTGDHIDGTPLTVEDRQEELDSLYSDLLLLNELSPKMIRLFVNGRWKGCKYPSDSEADMALFGAMLRVTENDRDQAMELLWQSGLARDKWDRESYLEELLDKVTTSVQKKEPEVVLSYETFDDFKMKRLDWFWRNVIPYGKLMIIMGEGGEGKSFVTCDIAARHATGADLPDGTKLEPGNTLLIFIEDDKADTVKPRLAAMGVNTPEQRRRIFRLIVSKDEMEVMLTIPDDVTKLEAFIMEHNIRLCIIDPVATFISGKLNTWNDSDVKRALAPLVTAAERTGCAIIAVMHVNKTNSSSVLTRLMGSKAFGTTARMVFLCGPHPDDVDKEQFDQRHTFAWGKGNVSAPIKTRVYRITGATVTEEGVGKIETARLMWEGETEYSPKQILEASSGILPEVSEAAKLFLQHELKDGPRGAKGLYTKADEVGISKSSLKNARKANGMFSWRDGEEGRWFWSIEPPDEGLRKLDARDSNLGASF